MRNKKIKEDVKHYYNQKLKKYGATPKGVDWNSSESQEIRFKQLLTICEDEKDFTINDYGCGYGALVDYMVRCGYSFNYLGYDISSQMVLEAVFQHKEMSNCNFTSDENDLKKANYTIASGIFNVKLGYNDEEWKDYVLQTIGKLSEISIKGFSFNILSSYSEKKYMRSDLYYANPLFFFDYCKKKFSKFISLLNDYPLYEFTIRVKKE